MTHPASPQHGGQAAPPPFSSAEVEEFRADDKNAATAIVGLMLGIFVMGVIGYLAVCYWVA